MYMIDMAYRRQGFYIMKTCSVIKTKTDLINEIRMFDINTKVYKLWLMPKKEVRKDCQQMEDKIKTRKGGGRKCS